jgi:hypothetical protein
MKVMSELLTQAHVIGIDIEELIAFFATQIQAMLSAPPNYNMWGQKERVWIMRGFYPDTSLFFKIVLLPTNSESRPPYYAKVSPLRVTGRRGESFTTFRSSDLNENITNKMENTFFSANHEIKPLLNNKLKMPRCMSPKGVHVFRYKKPRKRKGREKTN